VPETLCELAATNHVPRRTITRQGGLKVAPVVMSADEARRHGVAPLTIRVDGYEASMGVRKFPMKDIYIVLDSPPGAPISVVVWDCTTLPGDLESIVRAKLAPPWITTLEVGAADRGAVLGAEHHGLTFATDAGRDRMAWFAVLAKRELATALVAFGVPGQDSKQASAADVLSNSMIQAVLATLAIE
jgi:hypothetical protein